MRRSVSFFAAGLCSLVLAEVASAQIRPPRPGEPVQPRQGFTYPAPLYVHPNVQRAINMDPTQFTRLQDMTTRLQTRYQDDFNRAYANRAADRAALTQTWNRYRSDWSGTAREILNDMQMNRYRQLELQYRGPEVFIDPDVQRRLELTEEQRKQLDALNTEYQRQYNEFAVPNAPRNDQFRERWNAFRENYNNRLNSILNETQQKAWNQMTGERFTFPPPATIPPAPGR